MKMHSSPDLFTQIVGFIWRIFTRIILNGSDFLAGILCSSRIKASDLIEINGEIRRRRRDSGEGIHNQEKFPTNLFEILTVGKEASDNGPCVGYRPSKHEKFVYLSYEELIQRSTNFGAGLLQLGARSNDDFLVGIFA